jgi:AraC-like DNA-binding protein
MLPDQLEYQFLPPPSELSGFVESFWMLVNHSGTAKKVAILPDGRIDIFFSFSSIQPYHVTLMGLGIEPGEGNIDAGTILFAISFKLLAAEYLIDMKVASLVNAARDLPADLWGMNVHDLSDFPSFCKKVSGKMLALLKKEIDGRKSSLFGLIYNSAGSMTVKELSEKVFWSSRQINRYFTEQFGITLKAYCNILRFRASFGHIKEGKLFPEQNFSDQAHFIKEIKKLSGVLPKELSKNKNDRFIQFSVLPKK